jgi:hypothetical protein
MDLTLPHEGGADLADKLMISKAPPDVEIAAYRPGLLPYNLQADKVVVAGLENTGPEDAAVLARHNPVCWLHHDQGYATLPKGMVYNKASTVIVLSPLHYETEKDRWTPKAWDTNCGWFDTSLCYEAAKTKDALWAHRNIWHKGLTEAAEWAAASGAELTVMTGHPREEVLDAMSTHKRFVLISLIIDPGPLAVMEAQLSGCEIVANDLVGWYDEPADALRERIEGNADRFWNRVLNS